MALSEVCIGRGEAGGRGPASMPRWAPRKGWREWRAEGTAENQLTGM